MPKESPHLYMCDSQVRYNVIFVFERSLGEIIRSHGKTSGYLDWQASQSNALQTIEYVHMRAIA